MSVNHRNLVVALLFFGVIFSVITSVHPLDVGAQSPNQVGLVVGMGDGSVVTRCVEFAEAEISGYDLLMRSGLQVVATQSGGMGLTICQLGGEGCPADNCFCECTGSVCAYWSYWHLVDGEWSYSSVGANGHRIRSGDVDGWTWGKGDPPPVVSLEQICALSATIEPTPTLTDTPTLLPTATVTIPTHTPQPAEPATVLPTSTWTPKSIPSKSPTSFPSVTPTGTVTQQAPIATPSPTPLLQSGVAQQATSAATSTRRAARPSLTPTARQGRQERSSYLLFGVLLAVLLGVIVMVVLRRKR